MHGFWLRAINLRFLISYLAIGLVMITGTHARGNNSTDDYLFSVTNGLKAPLRIAQDKQGNSYVTDAFRKCILKYDNNGNYLEQIPTAGTPVLVAVSNDNQIIFSDNKNGRIMKIGSGGSQSEICTIGGYPTCAAFDANNNLYVVDSKKKHVVVLSLSGNILRTFGDGILHYPVGLAIDRKNNHILVAEHGGIPSGSGSGLESRICIFDLSGNLIGSFGKFGSKDGEFSRITGLTVDGQGQSFIVDSYQARVSVFNENGEFVRKISGYGTDPGQLNAPMDICLDAQNRIWVTSMNKGSLEVFKSGNSPQNETIPAESELLQNYPNPFTAGTWIPYVLSRDEEVTINIYNIQGSLVHTLSSGYSTKGNHTSPGDALYWDGTSEAGTFVPSGVYFYKLNTSDIKKTRKMVFSK